jgi:WD40 repeat protein
VIVFERSAGHTDSVEAVALSSVLPVAATASIDGKLLIWDNATLSVRGTCEHPEVRLCLKLVACCSAACMLFEHFVVEEGACHVHADFINCNRLLCDALSAQSVLVQFVLCRKSLMGTMRQPSTDFLQNTNCTSNRLC